MKMRPVRRPRIESLETRALLSALLTETEPNNRPSSADVIPLTNGPVQTVVLGRLRRGDVDNFEVVAPADGTLQIGVPSRGGNGPSLTVTDENGDTLLQTQAGSPARIQSVEVEAGQTVNIQLRPGSRPLPSYMIALWFAEPTQTGSGTPTTPPPIIRGETTPIVRGDTTPPPVRGTEPVTEPETPPAAPPERVTAAIVPADVPGMNEETEPNNSEPQAAAVEFSPTGSARIAGELGSAEDQDFYSFTPDAPKELTAILVAPLNSGVSAEIVDGQGNVVATVNAALGQSAQTVSVASGVELFVRVHQAGQSTTTTAYRLMLRLA